MLGVIRKRRPDRGQGGDYVKVDKCGHGKGVFKLQWTSTVCTSLDNYCDVLLAGKMAEKWACHLTPFYGIMNLVLRCSLTFICFACLFTFNRLLTL